MPVLSKIGCRMCDESFDDLTSTASRFQSDDNKRNKSEPSEQNMIVEKPTNGITAVSRKRVVLVNALYCELCDVSTTGVGRMVSHFMTKKHSKNLRYHADERKDIKRKDNKRKFIILKKEVEKNKLGIYECSLCSIDFDNKRGFKKHMKSEYHHQQINIVRCLKM